ncbi:MAG: hypothetical protein MK106_03725 [Mariniblastus sp.]|nr:hypothetical protein [Mariniblastus sp.]
MIKVENSLDAGYSWSALVRSLVSIMIGFYLCVVLLGPLANPVGSDSLTVPLNAVVRPIHQLMYLGHGYRFFGPDPGPSHLLVYRIKTASGKTLEGRFPNRRQHWPRLLYHRWFMLSESIYDHYAFTPSREMFQDSLVNVQREIDAARDEGAPLKSIEELESRYWKMGQDYDLSTRRFEVLIRGVARYLLTAYEGQSIQLFCLERSIPLPADVRAGIKLADPRYLSAPRQIAEFTLKELQGEEIQ